MRRREFITLAAGSAVAWPVVVRAEQPALPVVGFLNGGAPESFAAALSAFLQGLKEADTSTVRM